MNYPMAKEYNVPPVETPAPFVTAAAFNGTTSFLVPQFGGNISGIETGLENKPPLLKKLGINTRQIWSKTVLIVNPFRVNTNLQEYANLSGITYGTVLKLMHEKTKVQLHSHEVPYGSGSRQQSVTGFSVVDDSNSYWVLSISVSHFQGKVTILTTSTQGIGSSIAEHLGFANRFKNVDKAVEKLKSRGIEVFEVVCHVSVVQQRKSMVERLFR
ncbi:unnamed protein product [Camellia sinensis]